MDQIITKYLSSQIIPIAAAVALIGSVHGSENFRIVIRYLDAEASASEMVVSSKLCGDASEYCSAEPPRIHSRVPRVDAFAPLVYAALRP